MKVMEITEENVTSEIQKAANIIVECMEINGVPIPTGLSSMFFLITSRLSQHYTFEEYLDFLNKSAQKLEFMWDEKK